ncbi:uncharacterized protein TNCT_102461 [Trichonephila clavata]|uniref:CCHC-type domain-containing protein n=1 Tax=Trichonephila clavata TaxID=2740835 RepID=A0A8X6IIY0_TRICU|nr:uncharacterized protein TNCT_102461 [Trichonephila clavata]
MAFLAKGKKADLMNVCEELGENVPPNSRVPDIKHIILETEQQRLEREAEQQRREAEQQRLEREAEQRRLEREAEAEQRQIELQRLEIRRLELQAAPGATTPPGRTEEVHHKIPLAQITPKFDEKKDEMSLFLVNFERRAEMARVPREEWAKAPEDIKDHFFGEWLELKQPEELANKFDEFESLKDRLRNNHHGRKQNESRPSHNDKSRFQDNHRKLSDNHARFRDNRGKYNDNHGRSTENHTRFYDKRQTKTEPGGRGSMPAQSKTSGQKNFRCYECDSPDHLRNACPELRRSQGNEINTHSDTHPVHIVNEVPEEAIEYPDVDLQKFTRQVKIGDFVVTALLDTGSVRNLIRFDVYKRMNPKTKLWRESTVLTGLGQGQVKTLGSFRHVAEIDGHVCRLDFQVVPSAALKFEAIIGSAFLAHAPCPFHEEKVKPESPDWIFNISKKEEQDEPKRHTKSATMKASKRWFPDGAKTSSKVSQNTNSRCAKLEEECKSFFRLDEKYTDSNTAISWIRSNDAWGTFVGNRVKEICAFFRTDQWSYVPGPSNPADPSRGFPLQFSESDWWSEPDWLKDPGDRLPKLEIKPDEILVSSECKKGINLNVDLGVTAGIDKVKWYEKFSVFSKMI